LSRQRWKVLAVDDEPDILTSLALSFDDLMPEVEFHQAGSGEEGMEKLVGKAFDAVISDYRMPNGMDGLDFLAKVRHKLPKAKLVMLTAYPRDGLEREARDRASLDLLFLKPYDPESLVGTVAVLLRKVNA
jgi:CheY-like chemotaxis protein